MKTKGRMLDNFSLLYFLTRIHFTLSGVTIVNHMAAVNMHHFHTTQICSCVRGVYGVHCFIENKIARLFKIRPKL